MNYILHRSTTYPKTGVPRPCLAF